MLALTDVAWYAWGMATVTGALRAALERCGQTRYEVSKATGIPQSTLSRFLVDGKPLRGENIDKLAAHLRLGLRSTLRKGH